MQNSNHETKQHKLQAKHFHMDRNQIKNHT